MSENSSNSGRPGDRFDSLNTDIIVFESEGNTVPTEPPSEASMRYMEKRREQYLRALAYCREHNLPPDGVTDLVDEQDGGKNAPPSS
jgi:hypothetical protein